jgi:hypothetical protein
MLRTTAKISLIEFFTCFTVRLYAVSTSHETIHGAYNLIHLSIVSISGNVLRVLDGNVVVVLDPTEKAREKDVLRMNRSREKRFAFDYAFGPNISSTRVYENTTKFLIEGVINGFNATVFAYGATGAGELWRKKSNSRLQTFPHWYLTSPFLCPHVCMI